MDQGCSCLPTGVFMGSLDKTKDRFSPDNAFLLPFVQNTPCHFSPLAEIPGSIEHLENSLTFEGVQWRKIT